MRVLFTVWAWPSHFQPLVPTAWALRAAGHEVRVLSQPALAEHVLHAGLTFVAAGQDTDANELLHREVLPAVAKARAGNQANGLGERELMGLINEAELNVFVAIAEAMAQDTVRYAQRWRPDLIVHDAATLAGPIAAAAAGVPAVRHLWGPDYMYHRFHAVKSARLGALAARFDSGDSGGYGLTIDPCPDALQVPLPFARQPMRYVPYNGIGACPDWLLAPKNRPRVAVTWGTSTDKLGGGSALPQVVQALGGAQVEVVLAIGEDQREALGPLPDSVRVAPRLPLALLLPTCDAVVHQGGGGTTLTAVVSGTPQVAITQWKMADQAFNAGQIQATGAGTRLPFDEATPAAVAELVARMLEEPRWREAAGELRDAALAQPSPAAVVATLEQVAGARPATG